MPQEGAASEMVDLSVRLCLEELDPPYDIFHGQGGEVDRGVELLLACRPRLKYICLYNAPADFSRVRLRLPYDIGRKVEEAPTFHC